MSMSKAMKSHSQPSTDYLRLFVTNPSWVFVHNASVSLMKHINDKPEPKPFGKPYLKKKAMWDYV